jgi:hypothetical protein
MMISPEEFPIFLPAQIDKKLAELCSRLGRQLDNFVGSDVAHKFRPFVTGNDSDPSLSPLHAVTCVQATVFPFFQLLSM